ncbi:MAG: NACHT domain-containing protein [Microcoleus sp.]
MPNTNMLSWDSFLEKAADNHKLFAGDDRQSFLKRFSEQNLDNSDVKVAAQLNISEVTLQKRLGNVYKAFIPSCANLESNKKGKFKILLDWLKSGYRDYQPTGRLPWLIEIPSEVSQEVNATQTTIDWRDICGKVLETQQLRRQATAQQYELNIYVPLGLMERPKTPNPRINPPGENSQPQKEPELQIVQTYKNDDFFLKVIAENRTEKGKHIAIIGEPGAGKTTLLGKLVEQLPKNSLDFPIYIRLADLQGITIKDYLVNNWLEKAVEHIDPVPKSVTPEIIEALKQLFRQSKVWLLLDGVDEMAAESPVLALAKIREQLKDWVGKARVVLTCRLNVWDAAIINTLTNFDTYKTLEFEPDDVDEFICQWFEKASWHSQGKRLQQQLKEPGKERIRELVRNPLRLSMLCQSWCVAEQDLPETKAALYEQFTTYFFEWKQEEFQKKKLFLNYTDKKQIQQALAKLALAAMESVNRFRIEEGFAIDQMKEKWFKFAGELGWLVLVDRDTHTKNPIYAFFHATFQEYFAACAVDKKVDKKVDYWDFFLPRNHIDKPVIGKRYRIFEPQWREVILLWLGRREIEGKQKQEFIDALVNFKDGCGEWGDRDVDKGFYEYRAYFLAAAGIAEIEELKNAPLADQIVMQIRRCLLGDFNSEKQEWEEYLSTYIFNNLEAQAALQETVRYKAIKEVIYVLNNCPEVYILREAINLFGKIAIGNQTAIDPLVKFLTNYCDESDYLCRYAAENLGIIDPENTTAIDALVKLIEKDEYILTPLEAAESLIKISPNHEKAVNALVNLLVRTRSFYDIYKRIAKILEISARNNHIAINTLIKLLETTKDEYICLQIAEVLGSIDPGNKTAIDAILLQVNNYNSHESYTLVLGILEKLGKGNQTAINTLDDILKSTEKTSILVEVAKSLGVINPGNQKAKETLVNLMETTNSDDWIYCQAAKNLGIIDAGNQIAIDNLTDLMKRNNSEYSSWNATNSLIIINPGNQEAIKTMFNFLKKSQDSGIIVLVRESLSEIAPGDIKDIDPLVEILNNPEDPFLCVSRCLDFFKKMDVIDPKVITALITIVKHNRINDVVETLKVTMTKKDQYCQEVVSDLKKYITDDSDSNNVVSEIYEIIWHCAQNLPYPDFYQAWHQDTLTNSATASLNLANLPQDLAEAINDRPDLCSKVKLICIDTHQFIDPENPAPEIYDEMLDRDCPEWQNGYPDTMQKLKLYWNSLRRQSEIPLFFICYDSTALSATPTGFSDSFLKALSKFDRGICVVREPGDIPLQTFSPQQQDLVAAIVQWIEKVITEN